MKQVSSVEFSVDQDPVISFEGSFWQVHKLSERNPKFALIPIPLGRQPSIRSVEIITKEALSAALRTSKAVEIELASATRPVSQTKEKALEKELEFIGLEAV